MRVTEHIKTIASSKQQMWEVQAQRREKKTSVRSSHIETTIWCAGIEICIEKRKIQNYDDKNTEKAGPSNMQLIQNSTTETVLVLDI